jgi:hypothetical protein
MVDNFKPRNRDEIMLSIVTKENQITEKMNTLFSHCPEFSQEWIVSVELVVNEVPGSSGDLILFLYLIPKPLRMKCANLGDSLFISCL